MMGIVLSTFLVFAEENIGKRTRFEVREDNNKKINSRP